MASDLSFNIVALDQTSKTLDTIADRLENVIVQLNRIDGKNATAEVNVKTDQATSSLGALNSRFALLTAGIIAGSPLAGAAIIGGLGAGFIGAAALAEKSNLDVQASYKNLWTSVVAQAKAGADPLVANFVSSANQMEAEAQKLGPQLQQAFSYAGPDLVALTRGVDNFAQNAMPGVVAATSQSLPVFQGVSNAAGELGTAVGTGLTSASQHSTEYGIVVTSMGQVVGSVFTGAVSLVNNMAQVWAQNAGPIVTDVRQIIGVVTDLGQGAMPFLSAGVGVVAGTVHDLLTILGPLAPVLGTVGGVALVTFAAFKVAGLVTAGVNALAMGAVVLGGNMEAGAAKAALFGASMLGVEAESSAAAGAVTAAGAAAATAGTEVGIGLSAMAGPVGIIVGLVAGAAALGLAFSHTGNDATQLSGHMDTLTAALERSHGAFDQASVDALKADPDFKKVSDSLRDLGINTSGLADALIHGGPALDDYRAKLAYMGDINARVHDPTAQSATAIAQQGTAAKGALGALNQLTGEVGASSAAAADSAVKQNAAATSLATSSQYQQAAAGTANLLGLGLGQVTAGYAGVISTGGVANATVANTSETFIKTQLAVAQAATALSDRFVQADKQVVQASQSVADAHHSVAQAAQSVTDAEHSYEQAQRAVADAQQGVVTAEHSVEQAIRSKDDALAGVTTAEQNYTKAQQDARTAQEALNVAREKAIQDLKDLHLQMEDQVLSEEQARVKLFDATSIAAGHGITPQNVQGIASQTVNAGNEGQIKAAFDLISAQNALNNSLNSGTKLREQVSAADRAGVNGAQGVISAQNALKSAQDQVSSSNAALTKAHQAVRDAEYGVTQAELGLTKAHQAVTDAGYALRKAHQGVTDAQYQQTRASQQLSQATNALRDAQDAASRSLDIHTAAGQQNLQMVLSLWDAITKSGLPIQDQYRAAIDNVAGAFGISRDRAADYLRQLGLIPKDFQYSVTAITQVDRNNFDSWLKGVLSTGGYAMDSRNQQKTIGGTGYAVGGYTGDGGKWEPAGIVHRGEWVVPQEQVHPGTMPLLAAINSGQIGSDGASLPGYAAGGIVDAAAKSVYMGGSLGAAYLATNNARQVMGFPTMPSLPKYVPPPVDTGFYPGGGAATGGDALSAQNYARSILGLYGWGPEQMNSLIPLWNGESGWLWWKVNPSSGATGIPQALPGSKMAAAGPDWRTNPATQIRWGLGYIKDRGDYGSPAAAYSKWLARSPHWYADGGLVTKPSGYDNGGALQPGLTTVWNGTGKPENVRTGAQEDALLTEVKKLRKGGNTYVLHVYQAANNEIDLKAQFQRMEIASGLY